MENTNGLVIRFFMGTYVLCDGKCPAGVEPEKDEIYIGTIVKVFDTWEEADAMRKIVDAAYPAPSKKETPASITPMHKVVSCAAAHAWIASYDQTFTSMKQIIEELHANGYTTLPNYGTTGNLMIYMNGANVAEIQ
jgi:hypothetical protein